MKIAHAKFGERVWKTLRDQPLGSLTKRELELQLMQAAIDAGLLVNEPSGLAIELSLSLSRANGYLNDLSLRRRPISDEAAIQWLLSSLRGCEVVAGESHLSIPIADANLRIWLERKLCKLKLNPSESLRRDLIKLTPSGLIRLIGNSEGILSPFEALNSLPADMAKLPWVISANSKWKRTTTWRDTLSVLSDTTTIAGALPALLAIVRKSIA